MKRWYEDWGTWLIAVCALISLGVLIGHDLTEYKNVSSAISAIGTLMLGVAALVAIPYWRMQEKRKFQASYAASMHAQLSELKESIYRITVHCKSVELINNELLDFIEPLSYEGPIQDKKEPIQEVLNKMSATIERVILPRSLMLGVDFSARCRTLHHTLNTLLSLNLKGLLDNSHLDDLTDKLDDMLLFLSELALFER
jgi:hypothetical protein